MLHHPATPRNRRNRNDLLPSSKKSPLPKSPSTVPTDSYCDTFGSDMTENNMVPYPQESMKRNSIGSDVRRAGGTPHSRIVNAVPSAINGSHHVSDVSSDGFSLVDDAEDSLSGSGAPTDGVNESVETSTETNGTSPTQETGNEILLPSTRNRVQSARRRYWTVLLVGTLSFSLGLWAYTRNNPTIDDRDDDEGINPNLETTVELELLSQLWKTRLQSALEAADVLGVSITASALPSDWPYVSISSFTQRNSGKLSFWMPLIPDDDTKDNWRQYSLQNSECIDQPATPCELAPTIVRWPDQQVGENLYFESTTPPYLPIWQYSIVNNSLPVNYDLRTHPILGATLDRVLESGQSVLSPPLQADDLLLPSITQAENMTTIFFLAYPLFNQLRPSGTFESERQLVGVLATALDWSDILNSTIPVPSDSTILVGASCMDSYKLVWKRDENGYLEYAGQSTLDSEDSTGAPINIFSTIDYLGEPLLLGEQETGTCNYAVQVFSVTSIDLQDSHTVAANIAIGVASLGAVLGLVFLVFDRTVRQREQSLTKEAMRTRNIVSSLFPAQFHDRLFQSPSGEIDVVQSPEYQSVVQARIGQKPSQPTIMEEGTANANSPDDQDETAPRNAPSSPNASREESGLNVEKYIPSVFRGGQQIQNFMSRPTSMRSLLDLSGHYTEPPMQRLRAFLKYDSNDTLPTHSEHSVTPISNLAKDEPIADLFPEATVMFADIAGFTAWSSVREPTQVFKLLETIYRSFDRLARKTKVFKVETIGDCYVAVTGLPDAQPDHALKMAKFAKECMVKMNELTRRLEVSLGPETADLAMRFGLNSGPVTAGVLRGEKSRFQLFGDTVNFASRMESTGERNRIQASQATADLLILAGKKTWVHSRDTLVNAKGKGQVQTYWITPRSSSSLSGGSVKSLSDSFRTFGDSAHNSEATGTGVQLKSRPKRSLVGEKAIRKNSGHHVSDADYNFSRRSLLSTSQNSQIWSTDTRSDEDDFDEEFDDVNRQERLIDWNIEILTGLLKAIVAQRRSTNCDSPGNRTDLANEDCRRDEGPSLTALDEITEIIEFASPNSQSSQQTVDPESVELPAAVEEQLRDYVTMIACMYRDNFFHNFEHASHVLMSSQKLLKRVVNAHKHQLNGEDEGEYTSVIAVEPLTQFAIVFSALIHDVDHTGVPNSQLVKEKAHIAALYKNKSIAEQNSLDLAWDLLMSEEYRELQHAIFENKEEKGRFRQLVVNVVLATDIFDPDMIRVRNSRWNKAFGEESVDAALSPEESKNLKATIVIEYIMQASDVSHTMQHWHIYQKWNERLFEEMYSAFQVRRGDKDPSLGWFKSELWFFDNYIIPLARKLKECKVFGAASDECLQYAIENRNEWEAKGEEIVEGFVAKHAQSL